MAAFGDAAPFNEMNMASDHSSSQPDRLEIRPNRAASSATLVGGILLFIPLSVFMIISGDWYAKAVGGLGILFFGMLAGAALIRVWTMSQALVLTANALEIHKGTLIRRVPWRDIDAIGIAQIARTRMPAIRLSSYEAYVASVTPDARQFRDGTLFKLTIGIAAILFLNRSLFSYANSKSPAEFLRANRQMTGYDIAFSSSQIDRPAADFAVLLDIWWRKAVGLSS